MKKKMRYLLSCIDEKNCIIWCDLAIVLCSECLLVGIEPTPTVDQGPVLMGSREQFA